MNDLISINLLKTIKSNEKGDMFEFQLPREQSEFLLLTRHAGRVSGNCYHEGNVTGLNPKIFLLFSGKIKISYRKVNTSEVFTNIIEQPAIITVQPLVIHNIETIEAAIFIECNSLKDIETDRINEIV